MATAKQGGPRGRYTRGWILPNARCTGISTDCEGQMRLDDDVVEGEDVALEFQKWERRMVGGKNGEPPARRATPQHFRAKWESIPKMRAARGRARALLAKDEWGCMEEDITWGAIRELQPKWYGCGRFGRNLRNVPSEVVDEIECRCRENRIANPLE